MLPHPGRGVEITVSTTAEELDLHAITTLNVFAWGGQVDEATVNVKAEKLRTRIAAVPPDHHGMVVARAEGETVGYCRIVQDSKEACCWWLEGLVVHPAYRRRAVGRTIVYRAIAHAAARGAKLIRSETHADNLTSIAFHEKLGFHSDGVFTAADGDKQAAFSLPLVAFQPPGENGKSTGPRGTRRG